MVTEQNNGSVDVENQDQQPEPKAAGKPAKAHAIDDAIEEYLAEGPRPAKAAGKPAKAHAIDDAIEEYLAETGGAP